MVVISLNNSRSLARSAFFAIIGTWASASSVWAGKSLSFDGSGDTVATGVTIDLDEALSISVWVKVASVSTNNYAILSATTSNRDYWMLLPRTNTNGLTLQHRRNTNNGGSMATTPSQNISANTWTHVVLAKSSGSTVKVYQNNVKITEQSLSYTAYTPAQLYVGNQGGNANWLNGKIDEAAVCNLELSAAEVTALLDHADVLNTGLTQASSGLQTAEPSADQDDIDFVADGIALEAGLHVGVVDEVREVARDLDVLVVAI